MPIDEADAERAANALATSLCEGDHEAVFARFHPNLRKAYPLATFEADAERELAKVGGFQRIRDVATAPVKEYVRAVVACLFDGGTLTVQVGFDARGNVVELLMEARATAVKEARASALLIPVVLAIPVGFAVALARAWDAVFLFPAAFIGAVGWTLAFVLREPVSVLAQKRAPARAEQIIAIAAGPLQEVARIAAIATAGRTFDKAVSAGVGWAAVEALFVAATVAGIARARSVPLGFVQSVLRRASMTAFHLGAMLLIAKAPVFVVATIVVHGLVNAVPLRARAQWIATGAMLVVGFALFVGGLAVFSKL